MTSPLARTLLASTVVALGGIGFVACGPDDAGSTTCGAFRAMSDDQRLTFVKDSIERQGTDEQKQTLSEGGDAALQQGADNLDALCANQSDDTALSDIPG